MLPSTSLTSIATIAALCVSLTQAQSSDPALVGTWSTKSRKVITGPGFYNPIEDRLIEPTLTGISYSFTSDGHYEEAYYRAISNPSKPACPRAVMQWQHGTYTLASNGSIALTPIAVDGRQLTSAPCSYDTSMYIRYAQPELFAKYQVYTDGFHGVKRLDLYQFDGSPMHPMFLVASPPQMLPTQTLNPTASATGAGAGAAKTGSVKRDTQQHRREVEWERVIGTVRMAPIEVEVDGGVGVEFGDAERWFWAGLAMLGVGTVMFLIPTSK